MKNLFLSTLLVLTSTFITQGQQLCNLEVSITSLKNYEGKVAISIYNKKESFLTEDAVRAERMDLVDGKKVIFKFEGLPSGTYAVAVYHDENANLELDTNLIGIPSEDYGFSNNPATMFGPPSFEKASFNVSGEFKQIEVKL